MDTSLMKQVYPTGKTGHGETTRVEAVLVAEGVDRRTAGPGRDEQREGGKGRGGAGVSESRQRRHEMFI
jgi:hypothetical protein